VGAFHVKLNSALLAKVAGVESIDHHVGERLRAFADLLAVANQKINLVSRAQDGSAEIERQIFISIAASPLIVRAGVIQTCLDVGSGGGFPAIPLAILHNEIRFCLIEATAKKAYFLERTAQQLGLTNVMVLNDRFESASTQASDLFTLKAVTDVATALSWADKALNSNGHFLTFRPHPVDPTWEQSSRAYLFEQVGTLHLKTLLDIDNLEIVMFRRRAD
jgi:16S rRNA (guanine(527)-N(7))-methyltransferase RsmG